MAKEILLYSSIYSYTVADFIEQMEAAKGEDVTVRMNTPGGTVVDGYGAVAKFIEHPKAKIIKVDGRADSFGAFMCCYAENVECLDVSEFTFHRAAWPSYVENNAEYFTTDMKAQLVKMNTDLRAAMEGKMRDADFEKATGVSYNDLFSMDQRIDVTINAQQAKKLGLVSKVTTITPEKKAEIESQVLAIAALSIPKVPEATTKQENSQSNKRIMTLAELKAQHPAVYAEAKEEGIGAERDRVGAYMAFVDIDPVAVTQGIEAGKNLSQKEMAEFTRKGMSAEGLKNLKEDSAGAITTKEVTSEATDKEKNLAEAEAQVRKDLNLSAK